MIKLYRAQKIFKNKNIYFFDNGFMYNPMSVEERYLFGDTHNNLSKALDIYFRPYNSGLSLPKQRKFYKEFTEL